MIAPYADLCDFARIMSENARSAETRQAAQELMAFIKGSQWDEFVAWADGVWRD